MSSDFSVSWELSRGRFDQEVLAMSQEQLNFRLYPGALTIGEMAIHVAGVEIWFLSQLHGTPVPENLERIAKTATEGVVNDNPFPFSAEEITPALVAEALATAAGQVKEVIYEPSEALLQKEIKSALGPIITGQGALARFAFHPGYHHGQAYQIKCAPSFPA
ncbi:DinB family protein [Armatimonas sp.]|uniref:DinB family protein n=1 Tax=Armatimonas sp. TaxID=1872638 RepID=UPI00286A524B|nr:DinB family protein [Armatimonas sp.]